MCRLQKSIYGLKQASRQWYLKFHDVVTSLGFEENTVDSCIYLKISGRKFIFLILYVDDVLLASNDLGFLMDVKRMLSQNFDMKDLGEANFVLGIEIHRDRDHKFLGLSQKAYVDRVLERFGMKGYKPGLAPIFKGDRLNKDQCPKNDVEKATIKDIPYSSIVGSLMYSAVCTRPDIARPASRGGKIGPARWASLVRPKLGPGWAIKLLARKKPGQIWPGPLWPSPVWPGPTRSNFFLP